MKADAISISKIIATIDNNIFYYKRLEDTGAVFILETLKKQFIGAEQ